MLLRVVPEFELLSELGFEYKINGCDKGYFILEKDKKTFILNMHIKYEHTLTVESIDEVRTYTTENMYLDDFLIECFDIESKLL